MNIKLSFRDLSNLIYKTEMDNEEICMLTDIADNLADEMHELYTDTYDINNNEFIEFYDGNIFEIPVHDDSLKRIDVDITATSYFASIKRFISLARPSVARLYSIEAVKYIANTDQTAIFFKNYMPKEETYDYDAE